MRIFKYQSGEPVKSGDKITYHGESGEVEFVVAGKVGNPDIDGYVEKFPGGGVMVVTEGFGSVFLTEPDADEDLHLVARRK